MRYGTKTEDLIVAAVTSNLSEKEYSVSFSDENMQEGTLKVQSLIRCDKVYTLSKKLL